MILQQKGDMQAIVNLAKFWKVDAHLKGYAIINECVKYSHKDLGNLPNGLKLENIHAMSKLCFTFVLRNTTYRH